MGTSAQQGMSASAGYKVWRYDARAGRAYPMGRLTPGMGLCTTVYTLHTHHIFEKVEKSWDKMPLF